MEKISNPKLTLKCSLRELGWNHEAIHGMKQESASDDLSAATLNTDGVNPAPVPLQGTHFKWPDDAPNDGAVHTFLGMCAQCNIQVQFSCT